MPTLISGLLINQRAEYRIFRISSGPNEADFSFTFPFFFFLSLFDFTPVRILDREQREWIAGIIRVVGTSR